MEKENFSPFARTVSGGAQQIDSATKVYFSVQDATDGRKFKVFLKPSDMAKLRVQKIRRTLSQTTGYSVERIELYRGDVHLEDTMTGGAFDLSQATLLTMRVRPEPGVASRSPQGYSPPSYHDPRVSPPPPPPATPAREFEHAEPTGAASPPNHLGSNPYYVHLARHSTPTPAPAPAAAPKAEDDSHRTHRGPSELPKEEGEPDALQGGVHLLEGYVAELSAVNKALQAELNTARDDVVLGHREAQMLRHSLNAMAATRDSPELLTALTTQVAAERARSAALEHSNDMLLRQLRAETARRKTAEAHAEEAEGGPVRVVVRLRPPTARETPNPTEGTVQATDPTTVVVATPGIGTRTFHFFRALGEAASAADVWDDVQPMVRRVLDGTNLCVVGYGQTGSGKSHTVEGLLARTVEDIFEQLASCDAAEVEYGVTCTVLEVYLDAVRDLSTGGRVELRALPSGVSAVGATRHQLMNATHACEVLGLTASRRHRAHVVVTVTVLMRSPGGGAPSRQSQIAFLDLAGSERVSRSQTQRERIAETQSVNKSLSALGDVVVALASSKAPSHKGQHVPYRNSKLTLLLQDTLATGNCKVLLIACVCPSALGTNNFNETMSTLTFASRLRCGGK